MTDLVFGIRPVRNEQYSHEMMARRTLPSHRTSVQVTKSQDVNSRM